MLANAINTHVIIGEKANGQIDCAHRDSADGANTLFEHRLNLAQGTADIDGDGNETDTQYRWLMWYGKGRLIKYRRLDH